MACETEEGDAKLHGDGGNCLPVNLSSQPIRTESSLTPLSKSHISQLMTSSDHRNYPTSVGYINKILTTVAPPTGLGYAVEVQSNPLITTAVYTTSRLYRQIFCGTN
jgi:hypothetical protein